jgi:hypothetical protein
MSTLREFPAGRWDSALAQREIMSMPEILGLVVLVTGGWFLWDGLKAREAANAAMRFACKTEGLLFLDDTVGLESVWPVRNDEGRVRLRRIYGFEYSDTGQNRRKGTMTMVGHRVSALYLGPRSAPEGVTLH